MSLASSFKKPLASLVSSSSSSSSSVASSPLPSALSQLRAQQSSIFQTTYNPTHTRTGAKYLKKALRGQAMLRYITPSSASPIGRDFSRVKKLLENPRYQIEGRPNWRDAKYALAASSSSGSDEKPHHPSKDRTINRKLFEADVRAYRLSAADRGDVPRGFVEIESGNDRFEWLFDAKEATRRAEVEQKRIDGRGPPKKGEGRRSQMKRK